VERWRRPTQPWGRIRNLLSSEFVGQPVNWSGNWGQYSNPEEYLTDVPSFTLMYRPDKFHAVNETVWTGFPHQDDGTDPPVPPMDCIFGSSIECLYNVELVAE
jgi:peptide/nickel transport system substrate-binding protein